jgi:hypothetical protein
MLGQRFQNRERSRDLFGLVKEVVRTESACGISVRVERVVIASTIVRYHNSVVDESKRHPCSVGLLDVTCCFERDDSPVNLASRPFFPFQEFGNRDRGGAFHTSSGTQSVDTQVRRWLYANCNSLHSDRSSCDCQKRKFDTEPRAVSSSAYAVIRCRRTCDSALSLRLAPAPHKAPTRLIRRTAA